MIVNLWLSPLRVHVKLRILLNNNKTQLKSVFCLCLHNCMLLFCNMNVFMHKLVYNYYPLFTVQTTIPCATSLSNMAGYYGHTSRDVQECNKYRAMHKECWTGDTVRKVFLSSDGTRMCCWVVFYLPLLRSTSIVISASMKVFGRNGHTIEKIWWIRLIHFLSFAFTTVLHSKHIIIILHGTSNRISRWHRKRTT